MFAWKFREKFKSRFGNRYKLNENGASPLLQFLSEFNLGSCGWVSVSNFDEIPLKGRITRHSMEYQGLPKDIPIEKINIRIEKLKRKSFA